MTSLERPLPLNVVVVLLAAASLGGFVMGLRGALESRGNGRAVSTAPFKVHATDLTALIEQSPVPVLVDSLIVDGASTLGDVQVSDDGTLLVAAIEYNPNGGLAIYRLDTPRTARLLPRTTGGELQYGVHTAEVASNVVSPVRTTRRMSSAVGTFRLPPTVMMLRELSTLTIALGRAYRLRIFSISVAETYFSGTVRTSKPRALAAPPVRAATLPASAWSAAHKLECPPL